MPKKSISEYCKILLLFMPTTGLTSCALASLYVNIEPVL